MNKLALLIRRGIIKTRAQREKEREENDKIKYYDVWAKTEERTKAQLNREKMAYPAPKLPLPGHAERFFLDIFIFPKFQLLKVIDLHLSSFSTRRKS